MFRHPFGISYLLAQIKDMETPILNSWIDSKLAEIANELPQLVHENSKSFRCGHRMGYKQALLDLEDFMNGLLLSEEFKLIYNDKMAEYNGF